MKIGIGINKNFIPPYDQLGADDKILITDEGYVYCEHKSEPIDYIGQLDPTKYDGVDFTFTMLKVNESSAVANKYFSNKHTFKELKLFLAQTQAFNLSDLAMSLELNRNIAKALLAILMSNGICVRKYNWLKLNPGWEKRLNMLYTGSTKENTDENAPKTRTLKTSFGNIELEDQPEQKQKTKPKSKQKIKPEPIAPHGENDMEDSVLLEDPESLSAQLKKDFKEANAPKKSNKKK